MGYRPMPSQLQVWKPNSELDKKSICATASSMTTVQTYRRVYFTHAQVGCCLRVTFE